MTLFDQTSYMYFAMYIFTLRKAMIYPRVAKMKLSPRICKVSILNTVNARLVPAGTNKIGDFLVHFLLSII